MYLSYVVVEASISLFCLHLSVLTKISLKIRCWLVRDKENKKKKHPDLLLQLCCVLGFSSVFQSLYNSVLAFIPACTVSWFQSEMKVKDLLRSLLRMCLDLDGPVALYIPRHTQVFLKGTSLPQKIFSWFFREGFWYLQCNCNLLPQISVGFLCLSVIFEGHFSVLSFEREEWQAHCPSHLVASTHFGTGTDTILFWGEGWVVLGIGTGALSKLGIPGPFHFFLR